MERRIALITGSGRGIGKATAILAAAQGYDVCVNYVHERAAAEDVVRECESRGARAVAIQADVSDRKAVKDLFGQCVEKLGVPHLVVNNAGIIGKATRLADLDEDVLRTTFGVNLFGTIYCCQEAISCMTGEGDGNGGVIINISSIAAKTGSPGEYVHYAASKAAVETLTVGLAKELGQSNIRVNAVRAGTTDTDIHERSGNPDRPAMIAEKSPLGRVATPEDIAEAILWLASDKAGYATGSVLTLSGGI